MIVRLSEEQLEYLERVVLAAEHYEPFAALRAAEREPVERVYCGTCGDDVTEDYCSC